MKKLAQYCLAASTLSAILSMRVDAQTPVFPGTTWPAVAPENSGWSAAGLAEVRAAVESVGSSAFMIVTDGRVVFAFGDTGKTFLSHSMRKSFTTPDTFSESPRAIWHGSDISILIADDGQTGN